MENLNKVVVQVAELGADFSLSPEYWLSTKEAARFASGIPLGELISIKRQGISSPSVNSFVLDTGNADRGLLNLKVTGNTGKERISHKKLVPEGSVIISRLRPYLMQVAYIPFGFYKTWGIDQLLASTEFYVLTPKNEGDRIAYLVPWLLSPNVQSIFERATTGGHHPRFDEELLYRLTVPEVWHDKRELNNCAIEKAVQQHINSQLEMYNSVLSVGA